MFSMCPNSELLQQVTSIAPQQSVAFTLSLHCHTSQAAPHQRIILFSMLALQNEKSFGSTHHNVEVCDFFIPPRFHLEV